MLKFLYQQLMAQPQVGGCREGLYLVVHNHFCFCFRNSYKIIGFNYLVCSGNFNTTCHHEHAMPLCDIPNSYLLHINVTVYCD